MTHAFSTLARETVACRHFLSKAVHTLIKQTSYMPLLPAGHAQQGHKGGCLACRQQ